MSCTVLQFIELCSQEESFCKGNTLEYFKELRKFLQKKKLTCIGSNLQELLDKIKKDINSDRIKKFDQMEKHDQVGKPRSQSKNDKLLS